jgi:uncharacterized membrane protein YbhN (UPF0104 family)
VEPASTAMPDELHPRRLVHRMLELLGLGVVVVLFLAFGPGLGSVRSRLEHGSPGWVGAAVALEVLSCLSYVVLFHAVFCQRMSWRLSYQIGMSEQAANSVLSVSGAGGLALGVWALRRAGMSTDHIARRTVAFFLLTSAANVGAVILFASLSVVGLIPDPNRTLTIIFGLLAIFVTVVVLMLPRLLRPRSGADVSQGKPRKLARAIRFARDSVGAGIVDAVALLRQRSFGVIGGAIGVMAFDIGVLAASFEAFGHVPPVSVIILGYLIGQLGGNLPTPAGIGGVDFGLIGTFTLYHQPLATTTAAVLAYHTIAIWVPALLGSVAFIKLRNTLNHEVEPAAVCAPLAEPIDPRPGLSYA